MMDEHGLYKCTRAQKAPCNSAYDTKCLDYVQYSYEQYINAGAKSSDVKVRLHVAEDGLVPAADTPTAGGKFIPRRAKLNKADGREHGYTIGCPGCEWIQAPMGMKKNHSESCRARMEDRLAESEGGQERLKRQKERSDHWLAGNIAQGDLYSAPNPEKDFSTRAEATSTQVAPEDQTIEVEDPETQIIIDDGMVQSENGIEAETIRDDSMQSPGVKVTLPAAMEEEEAEIIQDEQMESPEMARRAERRTIEFDISTPPPLKSRRTAGDIADDPGI